MTDYGLISLKVGGAFCKMTGNGTIWTIHLADLTIGKSRRRGPIGCLALMCESYIEIISAIRVVLVCLTNIKSSNYRLLQYFKLYDEWSSLCKKVKQPIFRTDGISFLIPFIEH